MKLNEVAEVLKIRGNSSDMVSNKHDIVLIMICQEVPILFRWGMNWQGLSVLE